MGEELINSLTSSVAMSRTIQVNQGNGEKREALYTGSNIAKWVREATQLSMMPPLSSARSRAPSDISTGQRNRKRPSWPASWNHQ